MVLGRIYVRRSASVPADDLRSPLLDTAVINKAHMISSHAVQDADSITAASRRHDRDFLNQVSNRMAAANAAPQYLREGTPVYIGSRYPAPPTHQSLGDYRSRTYSVAPPVSDYEVAAYMAGGPRPYNRASRGVSVPPTAGPSAPRWYPPTVTRGPARWSVAQPYSRASVAPYDDVVVGVAHTSLYGDIVIGIPYNKRHMFDSEVNNHYGNNLKRHSYAPPKVSNSYSVAPNYASRIAPVATNYRRASVAVPNRNIYDEYDDVISSPYRHTTVTTKRYDPDLDAEWPSTRPRDTVQSLRGRAHSVQRQLEGIPEFSTYTPGKTRAASVTPSYGSSYTANPPTRSYASGSAGSSLPPTQPAKRISTRPPVSEARRKVRDLLCKSKNNPRYFDD